jgi:hypothetical protein
MLNTVGLLLAQSLHHRLSGRFQGLKAEHFDWMGNYFSTDVGSTYL